MGGSIQAIRLVRDETDVEVDASLGILTEEEAEILADEGSITTTTTSRRLPAYFPEVVQTHTFQNGSRRSGSKDAGMDLARAFVKMRESRPTSETAMAAATSASPRFRVIILNPVAGIPMAEQGLPVVTIEAVSRHRGVRLLHPESRVRLTGGREVNLDTDGRWPRRRPVRTASSLANLTTEGQTAADDLEIMEEAGLEPNTEANEFDPEAVNERAATRQKPRRRQRPHRRNQNSNPRLTMDDIRCSAWNRGIGRRTLEVSQHKDGLTAVAACDRNGVALDHDGLDVDELLEATEGNIATGRNGPEQSSGDEPRDSGPRTTRIWPPTAAQPRRKPPTASNSTASRPASSPFAGRADGNAHRRIIAESDAINAVLLALPDLEHDFIPRVAERFAEADYEGVMIDVLKRSRVIGMLDDREDR